MVGVSGVRVGALFCVPDLPPVFVCPANVLLLLGSGDYGCLFVMVFVGVFVGMLLVWVCGS